MLTLQAYIETVTKEESPLQFLARRLSYGDSLRKSLTGLTTPELEAITDERLQDAVRYELHLRSFNNPGGYRSRKYGQDYL